MTAARVRGTALDVSSLPTYGFSHRSIVWWATLGMIAVEATVFALAIATYFYLRSHATTWPLAGKPPDLLWGTINTLVMLGSLLPNHLAKKAAEKDNVSRARLWMAVCLAMGLLFLVIRIFEFRSLNTGWDTDAYGSIVWTLLGLHTVHLVTDFYDSAVLTLLLFIGPLEGRHMQDVSENAFYWYFVVASWLPIYLVIYWAARLH
ncbi:MAG: cytochrome oxidase subunit [Gemmatimonadetes bacterium]|nr:cytochrome oxidase subunit [Gemmatimonadota bacterium]